MQLSTHYYVISLSEHTNALYEAFRDEIIDIRNGGFPVEVSLEARNAADSIDRKERLQETLRIVDKLFDECCQHDPLGLVLIGKKELQRLFVSLTAHRNAILGFVEGDHSSTSLDDLGKIAWPIVKEVLTGLQEEVMRELDVAASAGRVVCGLDAVSQIAHAGVKAKLLVEDDYHVRGSISRTDGSLKISRDVDVMEELDDTVDVVIEKVLGSGGKVVFTPSGALHRQERMVLLLNESEVSR